MTVIQFSGIGGIDKNYLPGSGGSIYQNGQILKGLHHYKVQILPYDR